MKSKVLLASILLLATVLAGCSEPDQYVGPSPGTGATPPPADDGNATTNSTTGAGNTTAGNGTTDAPNTAPVASLVASAINGTAPLNVTFTLDGSDADGDALSWTLKINGTEVSAGTALPATFDHVFAAGNHTVMLTVSDGSLTGAATRNLAVAIGDPNAGLPAPIVWTGDTGSTAILCDPAAAGPSARSDGYHGFDPAAIAGWTFQVSPASGLRTSWWTGAGTSESKGTSGTVPSGRDNVGVCPDGDEAVLMGNVERTSYTMTLYAPGWVQ